MRNGERVVGVLGQLDLVSFVANHSHIVALQIDDATGLPELRAAAERIDEMVRLMHGSGIRIDRVTRLVSELNTRLFARLWAVLAPAEIVANTCLLVMGSEGRGEQILKTDQDNALILADDLDWPQAAQVCEAFSAALEKLGYPPCPGKVMVNNPDWRLRQSEWRERLYQWSSNYDPNAMLELAITVDARPIAGNAELFEPLQRQIVALGSNDGLMRQFAAPALSFNTPLTLFGKVKTDGNGLDIKKGGVFPIVQGLRALALKAGIAETNSFRRAELLAEAGVLHTSDASDAQQALSVFLRLRLSDQLRKLKDGQAIDNHIDVAALRRLDRELLRDALRVVNQFKDIVAARFKLRG